MIDRKTYTEMLKVGLDYLGIKFDNVEVCQSYLDYSKIYIGLSKNFELPHQLLTSNNQSEIFKVIVGEFLNNIKSSDYFKQLQEELIQAKEIIKELEKYKTYYELDKGINLTNPPMTLEVKECKCK